MNIHFRENYEHVKTGNDVHTSDFVFLKYWRILGGTYWSISPLNDAQI